MRVSGDANDHLLGAPDHSGPERLENPFPWLSNLITEEMASRHIRFRVDALGRPSCEDRVKMQIRATEAARTFGVKME